MMTLSLAVFAFGSLAFSSLAWQYWRQPGSHGLFRMFTLACAAAFLGNIIAAVFFLDHPVFEFARGVVAGLLPPMMLHLVLIREGIRLRLLRLLMLALYGLALLQLDEASAPRLGASALAALVVLVLSRRPRDPVERRHWHWNVLLFAAFLLTAIGASVTDSPLFDLIPDYLLLVFFAVWLYYCERLAFFDVFLKEGVYFVAGSLLLAGVLTLYPGAAPAVIALLGVWLAGPPVHSWLSAWVDRHALHRKHSPMDAERVFVTAIQAGSGEVALREAAEQSFREVFHCDASVSFQAAARVGEPGDVTLALEPEGWVRLRARRNQVAFLSDDHRLLQTLATTLSVVLQNVRFRARQQEFADYASRAELRALRAQINPHFLFNALNAIAGWIRVRPDVADETISQLAEVFRYALNRSQQEWVRLGEELDFVRAYLAVEKARFGEKLELEVTVDAAVESVRIPAMTIQPLVENAIKYGT